MATATAMYHTLKNPLRKVTRDSEEVMIPKGIKQRRLHKAFLRYHDPNNWPVLREALTKDGPRRPDRERQAAVGAGLSAGGDRRCGGGEAGRQPASAVQDPAHGVAESAAPNAARKARLTRQFSMPKRMTTAMDSGIGQETNHGAEFTARR